jgi:hypothetical protein
VIERRARRLEGLFQILQHVRRLQLDIRTIEGKAVPLARFRWHAGLEVAGELACGEDEIADDERFVVIGERARDGRGDDFVLESLARHVTDKVDLDQRIRHQESGAADGGARRGHLEIPLPHRVEAVEVVEVGEKYLRLDHVLERGARRREGLFQIFEDIRCLQLDVGAVEGKARLLARLRGHAGFEIARQLTGGEHEITDDEGLIIVGERARNARFDNRNRHVCPRQLRASVSLMSQPRG